MLARVIHPITLGVLLSMKHRTTNLAPWLLLAVSGCATYPQNPMPAVSNVDLERFMGNWYVLANVPTFAERGAFNPLETYRRNDDGTIATTFTFNKKHVDGPAKTLRMTGFVNDAPDNGVWRMQWIWPIKADYRIAYLDEDYQLAIIGRNRRDYVWLMSRTPNVDQATLDRLISIAVSLGYERDEIQLTNWQQS
jgi:apolipoprotein D and lipocalin family protein